MQKPSTSLKGKYCKSHSKTSISLKLTITLLFFIHLSAPLHSQELRDDKWYRFTNVETGKCLQINYPGNSMGVILGSKKNDLAEQLWGIHNLIGKMYNKALSYPYKFGWWPHLSRGFTGVEMGFSGNGESWEFVQTGTPKIYMITQTLAANKTAYLYAKKDGSLAVNDTGFPSAKSKLWKIEAVADLMPGPNDGISFKIPKLSGGNGVRMTEAGPAAGEYMNPIGWRKGIVLFVDFNDFKGESNPGTVSNPILNFQKADNEFMRISENITRVSYKIQGSHWRSLLGNADDYRDCYGDFTKHSNFIQESINLYNEVDFNNFDFVVIVTPHTVDINTGSASITLKTDEAFIQPVNQSKVRSIITMGEDVYTAPFPYKILLHELGHLFGLPDLYKMNQNKAPGMSDADYSEAGPWGLMSDADRATDFLGWHKYILGYLKNQFNNYITEGKHTILVKDEGISVVPIDGSENPSKVLVIEKAPIIQSNAKNSRRKRGGGGILVYLVDAKTASGQDPIVMTCPTGKWYTFSADFGRNYEAPFHPGIGTTFQEAGTTIKIENRYSTSYNSTSTAFVVDVTVTPPITHEDLKKRDELKTIEVGNTIWLAENLNIDFPGSVCHSNNPANCEKYGRMYTWEQAKKACKQLGAEWRLASDDDWRKLALVYGGATNDKTIRLSDPAGAYNALGPGTPFNGVLGGKRYYFLNKKITSFYSLGTEAFYWTSSSKDANTIITYNFIKNARQLRRTDITPLSQVYCRCIKDK